MPDPNIQEAITEINAILRERNLAGVILLASPTHTHFDFKLDAPWNAIRFELGPQGEAGIRVKLKTNDYATREEAKKVGELTLGTILGMLNVMEKTTGTLSQLAERLAREMKLQGHVDRDEGPDIATSHEPLRI